MVATLSLPTTTGTPPPGPSVAWGALWAMAWPLVLSQMGTAIVSLLDVSIASHLGPNQAAAVGPCLSFLMVMGCFVTALSVGLQAVVSRAIGGGEKALAGLAIRRGLWLSGGLTALLLPLLWAIAPWAYMATGAPPEVVALGSQYLRQLLLSMIPLHLLVTCLAALRGAGLAKDSLWVNGLDSLVWASVSVGLAWFGGWGLAGLALGNGLGKLCALGLACVLLHRQGFHLGRQAIQPDLAVPPTGMGAELWRVGWPAGAQAMARNVAMLGYFGVLNQLPQPAAVSAAFSAAFRLEAMAFMPIFALNLAAASLVGRALGAGQVGAAKQAAWRLAGLGALALGATAVGFIVWAEPLAALCGGPDPEVRAMVASYLRIAAVAEPLLAVTMVLNGALQGAGATRIPMLATLLAQVALRWPLAWLLAVFLGWGPAGAWAAIPISLAVQATVIVSIFWRGRWAVTGLRPIG